MDYSHISYNKPSLSQAIIRLDFMEFIDTEILFNSDVESALLPYFPKKGMQQLIRFQSMNFTVNSNGSKAERAMREGLQQEFIAPDGNKLVLSNRYVVFEMNHYISYKKELEKITSILGIVMGKIQLTVARVGIRYINEFGVNGIKPQKNYFSAPASAFLDSKVISSNKANPIRAMALSEFIVDDMHLNFRYGQYNPQYPQPMRQVSFALDYDCFCEEPLKGLDSVREHINKGHDAIQELFEASITDKLRGVMQNG